jgi:cytochrome c nitrite reductase small subunit
MYKRWGFRSLAFLGACVCLFLVFAFALQVPAVGKTIGSPKACGTCHVMTYEVQTLTRSAHRDLSCLDCHSPKGFVEKPVDEIKSASRHLFIFVSGTTPDVIKPLHSSKETIQENCTACHAKIGGIPHIAESGRYCFDCHRETPHGRPLRN